MSKNQNIVQTSMVSGILSKDSIGRTDIGKYHNGVAEATNMTVEPLGGLKKRVGFEFLGEPGGDYRMIDFMFSTDDKYVILVGEGPIKIWDIKASAFVPETDITATVAWFTLDQAKELDFVQSADTVIFTHESIHPRKLVRDRSLGDDNIKWVLSEITLSNIPQYNWNPEVNAHDSDASREKKAETEGENDILNLRDEIIDAISVGEGIQPRIYGIETEKNSISTGTSGDSTHNTLTTETVTKRSIFSSVTTGTGSDKIVTITDYEFLTAPTYANWGTRVTITTTNTGADFQKDDYVSDTVIYDKTLEEIINDAVRSRISLKSSSNNYLTETQLQFLVAADGKAYTDEVYEALAKVIGSYDIDPLVANVWNDTNGYPRYCTFYQNRLFFAGSPDKPMSIWGSVLNDFFNFDISESDADYAIADTLNTNTLNHITGLFPSKVLQIYTSGAEFINTSEPMTPTDSNWVFQTGMGTTSNVKLDSLDGSTIFVDRSGAIREFVYNFDQDNYIAKNIALLASQVIKNPSQVVIIRSSQIDLAKLVYFLNDDGTLAVLNIDNNEKILAWTEWETEGKIVQIAGVDQSLFVLVLRNGIYSLEILGRKEFATSNAYNSAADVFLDASLVVKGTEYNDACEYSVGGGSGEDFLMDGIWGTFCPMFQGVFPTNPTEIAVGSRFDGTFVTVLLDEFYHGSFLVENGIITVGRTFGYAKIGYLYKGTVKTLPLSNPQYPNQLEYKRIIKILVNLFESSGVELDGQYVTDRNFDEYKLDSTPELISGIREVFVLGWDKLKDFTIESNYPYNFHVLSFTSVIDSNGVV